MVGVQAVVLWQTRQLPEVGMWAPVFPVAPLPLWQLAHCVAEVNRLWSGLEALQLLVVLWQDSQFPVTAEWIGVAGLPVTP